MITLAKFRSTRSCHPRLGWESRGDYDVSSASLRQMFRRGTLPLSSQDEQDGLVTLEFLSLYIILAHSSHDSQSFTGTSVAASVRPTTTTPTQSSGMNAERGLEAGLSGMILPVTIR